MTVGVMIVGVMSVGEITVGVMTIGVMRRPRLNMESVTCVHLVECPRNSSSCEPVVYKEDETWEDDVRQRCYLKRTVLLYFLSQKHEFLLTFKLQHLSS
jgi:hypothetical protein